MACCCCMSKTVAVVVIADEVEVEMGKGESLGNMGMVVVVVDHNNYTVGVGNVLGGKDKIVAGTGKQELRVVVVTLVLWLECVQCSVFQQFQKRYRRHLHHHL